MAWQTKAADADVYLSYVKQTGIADYKSVKGNLSSKIWRRNEGDICYFYTVTEWDNIKSIKEFAGEDYEKAKYYKGDKKYPLEFEEKLQYFETFYELRVRDRFRLVKMMQKRLCFCIIL